jgi:hypothetical protein
VTKDSITDIVVVGSLPPDAVDRLHRMSGSRPRIIIIDEVTPLVGDDVLELLSGKAQLVDDLLTQLKTEEASRIEMRDAIMIKPELEPKLMALDLRRVDDGTPRSYRQTRRRRRR